MSFWRAARIAWQIAMKAQGRPGKRSSVADESAAFPGLGAHHEAKTISPFMHRRTAIGLLAVVLFAIGIALTLSGVTGAGALECQASSLRLGVLCSLVCLAYPELIKLPGWLFPALACSGVAAYRWRWLFALVPFIAAAGWLLQPRGKRRRRTTARSRPREPTQPSDA
jgi:hypothetical protein